MFLCRRPKNAIDGVRGHEKGIISGGGTVECRQKKKKLRMKKKKKEKGERDRAAERKAVRAPSDLKWGASDQQQRQAPF